MMDPRDMHERGTAFGIFNAAFGVAWLLGSAAMGLLYDFSPVALEGAATQLVAAAMFFALRRSLEPAPG